MMEKDEQVRKLRTVADEVILASDPIEGEAIAWHVKKCWKV
jgi:DNA topoisomerase IA